MHEEPIHSEMEKRWLLFQEFPPFPLQMVMDDEGIPGYGVRPYVVISISRMPKLHTSDFVVNRLKFAASGAVHWKGYILSLERGIEEISVLILSSLYLYLCTSMEH